MNERLQKFLKVKKLLERIDYEKEKEKTLIELGLCDKVYSPDNTYSEEFSSSEWNSVDLTTKYFKKVPFEVSDEEYEEIKRHTNKTEKDESKGNSIAIALTAIAVIIYIVGFIAGIAYGTVEVESGYYYTYTETEFSFAIAFTYWCTTFISGTIFLGFAEIIKLLNDIKNK